MIYGIRLPGQTPDTVRHDMNRQTLRQTFRLLILGSLLLGGSAQARDYQVEVVLFETVAGRDLTAGGLYYPKIGSSIRLGTEEAVAAGFRPLEQNLSLSDNAAAIAASRRYRLIRHLAWRQPGLDRKDAVALRISLGSTSAVYLPDDISQFENFIPASANATPERQRKINTSTVNGSILVHLGRFLHMETQLVFTDEQSGQSFRLSQSRKMRSRELHYIDNPRFGILTRILPIEEPEESSSSTLPEPEPGAPEKPLDQVFNRETAPRTAAAG